MTDVRIPARAAFGLGAVAATAALALALTVPSARTLGAVFESDGQFETATRYLEEWTREHPTDYQARLHTAELMMMTVHPQEAVRTLEAMARDWPADRTVLERLVDVEDSLLMVDATREHLERLAAVAPHDPEVLRRLADHYRWKGESERLVTTLLALTRAEDAAEERGELVDILLSNRRYDELIAWFAPSIESAPAAVDLRLALYEAYLRTGRVELASAELTHVLELSPDRVELLRPVADYLVERGMFQQAVALYRERIDRQPRDARHFQAELNDLYEAHAETLARGGKLGEAAALYRERVARAPLDVKLRLELAELYGERSTQVAIGELQQVVKLAPNSVEAWTALAERLGWIDRLPQATKAYRQAVALQPGNRALRRALAQNLLWSDHTDEALAQFRALADGGEEIDREAYVELLIDEDRAPEALAAAEDLGSTPRAGYLLGLAAHAAGDYELAMPELLKWTAAQGGDLRAWQAVVECASALDQPDVALTALRHVQALTRHAPTGRPRS